MIKALKRNQIVIFAIALMLITAGYLNYSMQTEQTAETWSELESNQIAGIGDARLVSSNDASSYSSAVSDIVQNDEVAYENEDDVRTLIDTSKKLEGLPRHSSVHAAGVVIGQRPMDEFVPLAKSSEGAIITQFTKDTVEELGLLKMDFLGLRNLTVIQDAVNNIKQSQGIDIDIDRLDMNDAGVYELISSGQTDGIFQLESAGMKSFMQQLKPRNIEDIIAGISLYRPGPMDFIPQYIKGKEHADEVTYACPQLEPILAPTYGCIVYQEQVMQIVMELAGYTLGRSDLVRRAMSKKKESVMLKERSNFVYGNPEENVPGCVNRGIDEAVANKVFDDMVDFAKYAFNKSHAAAYAVVAYQTAYLKCHYPKEFMAALLTSVLGNTGKVAAYISDCRKMGIDLLPPDINEGFGYFSVSDGGIRYGLSALKSVGETVIEAVVAERVIHGPYKNLKDFVSRLSGKEVNKRTLESFIRSGAFDCFPSSRRQMMMVYGQVVDQVNQEKKNAISGQMSLMDLLGEEEKQEFDMVYPDVEEYSKEELLTGEKEMLGIYVSGHPLDDYRQFIDDNSTALTVDFYGEDLDDEEGISEHIGAVANDQQFYTLGGIIAAKTVKMTKNNQNMAFITLEDLVGTVEVVVFPKKYEQYRSYLEEDNKVFVYGRASITEKEGKLLLEKMIPFSEVPHKVYIQMENKNAYLENERILYDIIDENPGSDEVIVMLKEEKLMKPLGKQFLLNASDNVIFELKKKFGHGKVIVKEGRVNF